jgi:hypothetical protein
MYTAKARLRRRLRVSFESSLPNKQRHISLLSVRVASDRTAVDGVHCHWCTNVAVVFAGQEMTHDVGAESTGMAVNCLENTECVVEDGEEASDLPRVAARSRARYYSLYMFELSAHPTPAPARAWIDSATSSYPTSVRSRSTVHVRPAVAGRM